MAGTVLGGKRAAATNKEKHGPDFYARIGAEGGRNSSTGGFASPKPCKCTELRYKHFISNCAGAKGGRKSRRTKATS